LKDDVIIITVVGNMNNRIKELASKYYIKNVYDGSSGVCYALSELEMDHFLKR